MSIRVQWHKTTAWEKTQEDERQIISIILNWEIDEGMSFQCLTNHALDAIIDGCKIYQCAEECKTSNSRLNG